MSNAIPKNTAFYQIQAIFDVMRATPQFVIDNKLWNAIKEQKALLMFAIAVSFLFTYLLYGDVQEFISAFFERNAGVPVASESLQQSEMIDLESIERPALSEMFSSSTKFMLMVILEVIIFSFSVKTLNILRNQSRILKFKDFWKAEIRMLVVMLLSFIAGIVLLTLTKVILGIIGLKFLTSFVMFFVYAYIIGYAFFDNFNEQFGLKIKQSRNIIWKHKFAALGLGLIATILLFIPLIGALIVPVFGGIAATMYGHQNNMELTPS